MAHSHEDVMPIRGVTAVSYAALVGEGAFLWRADDLAQTRDGYARQQDSQLQFNLSIKYM